MTVLKRAGGLVALLAAATLALAPAATAASGTVTVQVGTAKCTYVASTSGGAKAQNSTCGRVGARTQYISATGKLGWTNPVYGVHSANASTPGGVTYYGGETAGGISIAGVIQDKWQRI